MLQNAQYNLLVRQKDTYYLSSTKHLFEKCLLWFPFLVLIGNYLEGLFTGNSVLRDYLYLIKDIDDVGIVLIFVIFLIKNKFKIQLSSIEIYYLLMVASGMLSGFKNDVSFNIILLQAYLYLKGLLLFIIFRNYSFENKDYESRFEKVLTFFFFVYFVGGIVDFISPKWFRYIIGTNIYIDYRYKLPSVVSFTNHPWIFGWFMSFCFMYYISKSKETKKHKYIIYSFIAFIGALFSFRRKAIFGLIILFILFFEKLINNKKKFYITFNIIVIIGLIIFPIIKYLYAQMIPIYFTGKSFETSARNVLYLTSIKIVYEQFPLGEGLGTFASEMSRRYYSNVYHKYNIDYIWGLSPETKSFITDAYYPMIIGECGFLGVLFFIIFIVKLYKKLHNNLLCSFLLLFTLINMISSPDLVSPPIYVFIWTRLGYCINNNKT